MERSLPRFLERGRDRRRNKPDAAGSLHILIIAQIAAFTHPFMNVLSQDFQLRIKKLASQTTRFGSHVIANNYHLDLDCYGRFRKGWLALAQLRQNERAIADVAVFETYHEVS